MKRNVPKLAFYGDDFTGATDTLATVAQAGLAALLFLRPPTPEQLTAAGPLDCLGIAGAARSMRATEQAAELESVGPFFAQLGAPVTHYKTCSTFDSSPDIGSIGTAVRILRQQLKPAAFMPIVGGQPNLNRYCVFGNLFAAFQTGEGAYRLDRHPTMSRHPVTPMREADLRRHLALQGLERMAGIEYPQYDLPPHALNALIEKSIENAPDGVLFDIGHASHLAIVGRTIWQHACRRPLLAIGPSSVAQALLAHWHTTEQSNGIHTAPSHPHIRPADGPVFVLSGSMSPVTARQIEAAVSYKKIALDIDALIGNNSARLDAALTQAVQTLAQGHHVLAYTSASVTTNFPSTPPAVLAQASGAFLARVLERAQPRRIGIAGGDTSSYAVKALDIWGLSYLGQIDQGAALCRTHSDLPYLSGIDIMLKGGQMGSTTLFEKLLAQE